MGFYDPSRQNAQRYERLGIPQDPRVSVSEEDEMAQLEVTVRRRLRREHVIGAIIVVIIMALIAAYFILKPQFLGW